MSENAASSGRTTNGVKKVISAAITPAGVYKKSSNGSGDSPAIADTAALTAPAVP